MLFRLLKLTATRIIQNHLIGSLLHGYHGFIPSRIERLLYAVILQLGKRAFRPLLCRRLMLTGRVAFLSMKIKTPRAGYYFQRLLQQDFCQSFFPCSNLVRGYSRGVTCRLGRVYQNYNEAANEILDLQQDPHANDLVFCEEHTFGTRMLLFASFFSSQS